MKATVKAVWRSLPKSKRCAPEQSAGQPGILACALKSPNQVNRRLQSITLQQAADGSPTLAGLLARARDSSERLAAIEELIPPDLRRSVKAGPADGDVWCLLVQGSAAAAKLRQLMPRLVTRLKSRGWDVASIRLKVQTRQ